ncbi:MAG: CidA/LrgA family protein [Candidatus Amulumruptor caecigallinarius]|nr:CidA/LrgA family protein [Candidatus Amulumruptor caecigallinarius]MCM1396059.1 CidA/LrgA family protein [Candidatus Amulumruptor caecigallinarius]MCM1453058.1 CidA/LrgA family protein [bacterium]
MVILQLAVIFLFLAIGELIVWLTGVPVPSSIIGMLLLAASLQLRLVKQRHVAGVADFLVSNLGFFFVPAGVALLGYFDLIRDQWLAIVAASAGSTFVVIGVTGWIHQLMRRYFPHTLASLRHAVSRK